MKISNETLEKLLNGNELCDLEITAQDLARDLQEARAVKRAVVRFPMLVVRVPVENVMKVGSSRALAALVGERAAVIEVNLEHLAKEANTEPFPALLVPEQPLWILQLIDKRRRHPGAKEVAVCKARTKAELIALVEREKCEPYVDGNEGKIFKKNGPLEWFFEPSSDDAYINVIENITQYVAAARQTIPDVSAL